MITLEFLNIDARPKKTEIKCAAESIASIMAWYGGFHAGDRYAVYAGGVKLKKDQNGELIGPPPEDAQ